MKSDIIYMGNKGTPQGSVLSPFLFNIAMIKLPPRLATVPGLYHSLYADDITLWMAGGSDGYIQDALQRAVDIVEVYVTPKGLACSTQKSELLIYQPPTRGHRRVATTPDIELRVNDRPIPRVKCIRVLGLRIQADGSNIETVRALTSSAHQIARLICRIANKHHGLKEANLVRLVQTFIISRVAYVAPFLTFKKSRNRQDKWYHSKSLQAGSRHSHHRIK